MWKRMWLALAAATVLVVAAVTVAAATDTPPAPTPAEAEQSQRLDDHDHDHAEDCKLGGELSPDELAELNAETAALAEHLSSRGFAVTVATRADGLDELVFDEENGAIWEAIEQFYIESFMAEVAEWSEAEKAEWNADVEAEVAELVALGIAVEVEEIADGVYDIVWTEELERRLDELWHEAELDKQPEAATG